MLVKVDGNARRRFRRLIGVAEEDEEGGVPVGREIQCLADGVGTEEGRAFEVAGEAVVGGGEEKVLQGGAKALNEHVALGEAAGFVGPGANLVQLKTGE